MSDIDVRPVRDRAGMEDFIAAARRAEASNPRWIEAIHDETRRLFDSTKSPFLTENEVQPFVAYRAGEPVGRIAATVDAGHQRKYGDRCGFFGFLESVEDELCFRGLLETAEAFLRQKGMVRSRGPFGLNINGESGLLVEGFDEAHIVQTNHCPPYYPRKLEACGYAKATDLFAFLCDVRKSTLPERVRRETSRPGMPAIDIRVGSYLTFRRDLAALVEFYNEAWSENLWSLPISLREAEYLAKTMLPVVKPKWFSFASYRGELVSIVAQIPDVNEALQGLEGRLLPTGLPKLLWRLHVRGTRRARVMLAATAKKWRNSLVGFVGLAQLMAKSIRDARQAGVEEVEYSWILEHNRSAIAPVADLPARRSRVFRIYEKVL